MFINKSHLMSVGAVLTLAVAYTGVSRAEPSADAELRSTVSYADLNLTHSAGAERLYRRLQSAAGSVCASAAVDPIRDQVQRKQCMRRAMDDAVARVNAPELTKLHAAKSGQSNSTLLAGK